MIYIYIGIYLLIGFLICITAVIKCTGRVNVEDFTRSLMFAAVWPWVVIQALCNIYSHKVIWRKK